jgi:hypothetical protein
MTRRSPFFAGKPSTCPFGPTPATRKLTFGSLPPFLSAA